MRQLRRNLPEIGQFTLQNPIFKNRLQNVARMDLSQCMMLNASGPV
ncbi:MAG: hypothetical protein ACFNZZ_02600, partial [Veillonella parvula]